MKRVIALLLCLMLTVVMFAACVGEGTETHVHTYRDTWSKDANGHWYEATCDCEDVAVNKIKHTDKNNDGKCDICEFTDHEHTYSEDWTADCTNHWHAADCGHTVEGKDVAAHEDKNGDGACDVCARIIEEIHVHIYATEWTTDDQYHWYAPICEHKDAELDKQAHNINAAGICTDCGKQVEEIDLTDLKAVLEAAVSQNHMVTGGNVIYRNAIDLGWDIIESNYDVYFTLGNNQSYINYITVDYDYGSTSNQQWYEMLDEKDANGDNIIFGVTTYDGGLTLESVMGTPAMLDGYEYYPSTILGGATTTTLSETLLGLYNLSEIADTTENALVAKDVSYDAATGVYTMNYTVLVKNINYTYKTDEEGVLVTDENGEGVPEAIEFIVADLYTVTASFTIDDNYVIDYAEFTVAAYTEIDGDYTYTYEVDAEDPTQIASESLVLSDLAAADTYSYVVAQSSGVRTYTSAYPKKALTPSKFDLAYFGETVGETLNVEVGAQVQLFMTNIYPLTANTNLISSDDVKIEIKNTENPDDTLWAWFDSASGMINFYPYSVGTYTATITYGETVIAFTLNVTPVQPAEVGIYQFVMVSGFGEMVNTADEGTQFNAITIKPGELLTFTARVLPTLATQGYTYTIDNDGVIGTTYVDGNVFGEVFYDDLETSDVNEGYEALTFSSDVEGVYTVTFTSTANEEAIGTLVITVSNEEIGGGEGGEGGGDLPPVAPTGNVIEVTVDEANTYGWSHMWDIPADATFVPAEDGTYTVTVPAGVGFYSFGNLAVWMDAEVDYGMNDSGTTFEVTLYANEEYVFYFGAIAAGTYEITFELNEAPALPSDFDMTFDLTVDEENTNGWSDMWPVTTFYDFEATVAGTYTFTVPAGCGLYAEVTANAWGSAEVDYSVNETGATFSVELTEGQIYKFFYGATTAGTYTIGVNIA